MQKAQEEGGWRRRRRRRLLRGRCRQGDEEILQGRCADFASKKRKSAKIPQKIIRNRFHHLQSAKEESQPRKTGPKQYRDDHLSKKKKFQCFDVKNLKKIFKEEVDVCRKNVCRIISASGRPEKLRSRQEEGDSKEGGLGKKALEQLLELAFRTRFEDKDKLMKE